MVLQFMCIVADLKEVFFFGTRWISHKRKALQRVID